MAPTSLRRISSARIFIEFVRTPLFLLAYVVLRLNGRWLLAVPAAVACFFAAFVLMHDTMHNAFRLPKAANEVVLALVGLVLLKSGHGLRATHLRHHSRTLEHNDPEGVVVHWPLWRVVLVGPFQVLGNRSLAMRLSPRHPLVRTAALWSRWWTPMLSSLAFHDLHHQYPKVPTAQLSELANVVGPEVAFADAGYP